MNERQKPHFAWIAAVAVGAVALAAVAWWLWSKPGGGEDGAATGAGGAAGGAGVTDPIGRREGGNDAEKTEAESRAALDAVALAIEQHDFMSAAALLDGAEDRFGWSDGISELSARLALHEEAYRAALRPIEFRIESFDTDRTGLFARFSVEDTTVFVTEELAPNFDLAGPERRANLVTLRTSLYAGASLELREAGGIFGSDEVVLGEVSLAPLAEAAGGRIEISDADAAVRRLVIRYRPSPFAPGIHIDDPVPPPPADATAVAVVDAATRAIGRDDLAAAGALLARLRANHPGHADIAFLGDRIAKRSESLQRNRTTARFVVLELSADPKGGDKPWASGGKAPSFRSFIRSEDATLARSEGGSTSPFLVPEDALDPPRGNVLTVTARGDDELTFVVTDTSPTFGSKDVGSIQLPIGLGSLPRGSGLIVVEREPAVLVLPASDPNRLRRVVLRWTVER